MVLIESVIGLISFSIGSLITKYTTQRLEKAKFVQRQITTLRTNARIILIGEANNPTLFDYIIDNICTIKEMLNQTLPDNNGINTKLLRVVLRQNKRHHEHNRLFVSNQMIDCFDVESLKHGFQALAHLEIIRQNLGGHFCISLDLQSFDNNRSPLTYAKVLLRLQCLTQEFKERGGAGGAGAGVYLQSDTKISATTLTRVTQDISATRATQNIRIINTTNNNNNSLYDEHGNSTINCSAFIVRQAHSVTIMVRNDLTQNTDQEFLRCLGHLTLCPFAEKKNN